MLSGAVIMVCGVGTASALFVDYLADRALARGNATVEVRPLVTEAVAEAPSISAVAKAQATPVKQAAPVVETGPAIQIAAQAGSPDAAPAPPKPMPIEAVLPDAAAIAKVAIGHAMPADDAADDLADDALVTAYSDEPGPGEASSEITAAISPDQGEPAPVAKPRKAKAEKAQPAAQSTSTEIASLPGVDVGGMAGHPSEGDDPSSSKVRTVTKEKAAASGAVAAGSARVRQAVNMRAAAKKGAGVLGVVPAGASVSVLSCESWCQISYNGRTGWVYKSFLAAGAPKKEAAAEPKKPARTSSNRS